MIPDKLKIEPMSIEHKNKWTPSRKAGGILRVKIRFSLSFENEQADAGRDGRICLARLNSQARAGTGENVFFYMTVHCKY